MDDRQQTLYLQVRLARMLAGRLGVSLSEAARLMDSANAFAYLRENFGLFHMRGDDAILEDLTAFLKARGSIG